MNEIRGNKEVAAVNCVLVWRFVMFSINSVDVVDLAFPRAVPVALTADGMIASAILEEFTVNLQTATDTLVGTSVVELLLKIEGVGEDGKFSLKLNSIVGGFLQGGSKGKVTIVTDIYFMQKIFSSDDFEGGNSYWDEQVSFSGVQDVRLILVIQVSRDNVRDGAMISWDSIDLALVV
jgi:hypothetical protein